MGCYFLLQGIFLTQGSDLSLLRLLHWQETWGQSLGQEDPLEKEIATHSIIFAWEIPRTEELDRLQSMGLQRVRHDLATKHNTSG